MDEQKIYELLGSGNQEEENQGLKLLNAHKGFLLRKHRFPHHFNEEDRDDIFYWGIFKLLENTQNSKFQYSTKGNLEAYLYILIHRRIYHKGKGSRLEELTVVQENRQASTPTVFESEVLEKVKQLFDQKLGENCRKIILMRHQDGMRQKEIAEELKLAVGTVKNNSSDCMNKLKQLIDENPNLSNYLRELLNS